ncbi:hypothetical protein BURK1_02680 [Burkholderiales bacterium]|nr:hypothetical protein BURK1_02680 [Burkholderiales bacterium]
MRALRWIGIAAAAVVALVVAAAVVAYATIDTQAIVRYAAAEASRLTGREISARGPVTLAFWPRLAVVAHDVSIANAPGAARTELARAAVVRGSVATWPLLRSREIVAEEVELQGLDLALETLPDGRGNWQFAGADAPAAGDTGARSAPFRLGGAIVLVDATVSWRPPGGGAASVVAIPRVDVAPRDGGRYAWRGTFDVDGTRWTLDATTGDPVMTLRERVPFDLDAKLAGGGVELAATGRVERRDTGPAAVVDVSVAWEAGSERMSRWSPALAREAGRMAARLDAREKRYALDGIAGAFAGTRFDGNVALEAGGARPRVEGRLHADGVDLARQRSAARAGGPATGAERDPPLPLARLANVDADLDFVVDRLRVAGGVEATNLRGRVVVKGGRLAAEPIDADAEGGKVSARVHADAATGRGRVVVEGRGIELGRAAGKVLPGREASGGVTTFAIDLQGPASARFLAGASGSLRADVGPMRVRGAALDAGGEVLGRVLDAVNPFRRVDSSTEVQCFVARLAVRDGVAHAERTLALETSRLAVSASGTIDLARESLDLLVRPRARKVASLPSVELAEVIRVSGPIRQPSVRLDTLGAAKTALAIGGAIATGGWGLLATPLLSAGDDPRPCATARAGGKVAATAERAPGAGRGAEEVVDVLRGLFKRN